MLSNRLKIWNYYIFFLKFLIWNSLSPPVLTNLEQHKYELIGRKMKTFCIDEKTSVYLTIIAEEHTYNPFSVKNVLFPRLVIKSNYNYLILRKKFYWLIWMHIWIQMNRRRVFFLLNLDYNCNMLICFKQLKLPVYVWKEK